MDQHSSKARKKNLKKSTPIRMFRLSAHIDERRVIDQDLFEFIYAHNLWGFHAIYIQKIMENWTVRWSRFMWYGFDE